MTRLLKWIGIVVGVLVVVVVGAAIILPYVVPVNTYVERAIADAKSATGRDLQIKGPVHLSVLPRLAIDAAQVSFSNVPGAQTKDMITLGKLDFVLELFPLLRGDVSVDRLVLVDPVITLEVDKQGRPNWDFSPARAPGAAAPAAGAAPKPGTQTAAGNPALTS